MTTLHSLIERSRELEKAATKGPWRFGLDTPSAGYLHASKVILGERIYVSDGEFIASARTTEPLFREALAVALGYLTQHARVEGNESWWANKGLAEIQSLVDKTGTDGGGDA